MTAPSNNLASNWKEIWIVVPFPNCAVSLTFWWGVETFHSLPVLVATVGSHRRRIHPDYHCETGLRCTGG